MWEKIALQWQGPVEKKFWRKNMGLDPSSPRTKDPLRTSLCGFSPVCAVCSIHLQGYLCNDQVISLQPKMIKTTTTTSNLFPKPSIF